MDRRDFVKTSSLSVAALALLGGSLPANMQGEVDVPDKVPGVWIDFDKVMVPVRKAPGVVEYIPSEKAYVGDVVRFEDNAAIVVKAEDNMGFVVSLWNKSLEGYREKEAMIIGSTYAQGNKNE